MKIVIDIPDEAYNTLLKEQRIPTELDYEYLMMHGMPLPKGHGRLIDADALNLDYEVEMADDWKTAHEIANCVKYAPTIIEADKGEQE